MGGGGELLCCLAPGQYEGQDLLDSVYGLFTVVTFKFLVRGGGQVREGWGPPHLWHLGGYLMIADVQHPNNEVTWKHMNH